MKKPFSKIKFAVYHALNTRSLRLILAAFAAGYATVRLRKRCRVKHDGMWIQTFPNGTIIEPRLTLFTLQQIEASSCDLWMHSYRPCDGETVVDVGAGTGWDTLAFSRKVGRRGRVISIEAHPKVFSCLERMCHENHLDNVTLVQVAITDRSCQVRISDAEEHLGNRIIANDSGLTVSGMTLDQICRSLNVQRIHLLKMNIEGAEKQAIEGMTETIRKTRHLCIACHDFIADENGPLEMRTKAEVIAFLERNDFALSFRDSDPRAPVRDYIYGINRQLQLVDPLGIYIEAD